MSNRDRVDIMVDLETFSTESDTQLLQIAAVPFDVRTGQTFDEIIFNQHIDISQEKKITVSGSTLAWWLDTDHELLATLVYEGVLGKVNESEALDKFSEFFAWLRRMYPQAEIYLWGNGINFDNRILREKMKVYPISYRNDRDLRTLVSLHCELSGESEKELKKKFIEGKIAHDALNDCYAQIELASYCYKNLYSTT